MKRTDFRIGNWVEFKHPNIYYQFTTIQASSFEGYFIEETFKPILIDEHWLLNLGFEKQEGEFSDWYEHKVNYNIGFTIPKIKEYHRTGFQHGGNLYPHIKFVHQLQNIFHALTGEELKMSPVKIA